MCGNRGIQMLIVIEYEFFAGTLSKSFVCNCSAASIQSITIYIAPLQDPYSEALLAQAKQKRTLLRR